VEQTTKYTRGCASLQFCATEIQHTLKRTEAQIYYKREGLLSGHNKLYLPRCGFIWANKFFPLYMELYLEITYIREHHITTNTCKLHGHCLVEQDRQCTHNVPPNIKACSHNHGFCGKAVSITYSECVLADLVAQHANNMHHMILSPEACLYLPYFSTLFHKQHIFRKQLLNMFVFSLQLL
jgi:hypothetical protein